MTQTVSNKHSGDIPEVTHLKPDAVCAMVQPISAGSKRQEETEDGTVDSYRSFQIVVKILGNAVIFYVLT